MSFRAIPYLMFAALLSTSVVCSVATSAGHADVPIAESADLIQPLGEVDTAD